MFECSFESTGRAMARIVSYFAAELHAVSAYNSFGEGNTNDLNIFKRKAADVINHLFWFLNADKSIKGYGFFH